MTNPESPDYAALIFSLREWFKYKPVKEAADALRALLKERDELDCCLREEQYRCKSMMIQLDKLQSKLEQYDKAMEDAVETIEISGVDPDYHSAKKDLARIRKL